MCQNVWVQAKISMFILRKILVIHIKCLRQHALSKTIWLKCIEQLKTRDNKHKSHQKMLKHYDNWLTH